MLNLGGFMSVLVAHWLPSGLLLGVDRLMLDINLFSIGCGWVGLQ